MTPDEEVAILYQKEAGHIRGYLINCGAAADLADDCVSDGFLAVARMWEQLENPLAYAFTVARHQLRAARRLAGREVLTDGHNDAAGCASDPSDGLIQEEEEAAVRRALDLMRPGRAKEAITLRFLNGFSLREAAAIMGVSTGAAKRYAHEGISAMRALLNGDNGNGGSR